LKFTAIDFETADYYRDSACSVALVRVEGITIVDEVHRLIRPPRSKFVFTGLHGIDWNMCKNEQCFADVWHDLESLIEGVDFLAAHNAPFDRSVLNKCCAASGIEPPPLPWQCTVQIARSTWNINPTKLNMVCDQLGIPLKHHDALSDAQACAKILLAASNNSPENQY
jgi:DNA polymerase III subunit epsilon